ncbi:ester cyclase [Streptomyces fuscichromogenes]|uniref:ester cyclase n=1 Tax=Streptomyces fuscichromogenes TaxID=1324013 RepID=UPI003821CC46
MEPKKYGMGSSTVRAHAWGDSPPPGALILDQARIFINRLNEMVEVDMVRRMDALESNKQLVTRYYEELLNEGRLDIVEDLFTAEFLAEQQPEVGELRGRAAVEQAVTAYREGFSDFHEDVVHLLAEGDLVAARFRFTGTHDGTFLKVEPTGRQVSMIGMEIFRVENGKIADVWYAEPLHELFEQLGAISRVETGY